MIFNIKFIMKFLKVSGVVILFHAALAVMLIFQSGCQSIENSRELNNCPYVMDERSDMPLQPVAIINYDDNNYCDTRQCSVVRDSFTEGGVSVQPVCAIKRQPIPTMESQPVPTGRFKPMRPTNDFSNDGLLTSVDDLKSGNKVVSFDDISFKQLQEEVSYIVKSGDSLWTIAKRYNIGVIELANANGIGRDAVLKVGQKLIVPVKAQTAMPTLPAMPSAVEGATYTIARGDTLSEIALRFKVSADAIKKANNMQNSTIIAGKKIIIPGMTSAQIGAAAPMAKSASTQSTAPKGGSYTVQSGDSLSVIANRFGVTVANLMTWNNMSDAKKLRAGQSLIVKDPNSQETMAEVSSSSNYPNTSPSVANTSAIQYNAPQAADTSEEEESMSFDLFEDDDLFGTADEIPVITTDEE